jgi:hypothetical protein
MIGPGLSVRDVFEKFGEGRAADAPPAAAKNCSAPLFLSRHSGVRLRPALDLTVMPFVTQAAGRPARHRPVEGERGPTIGPFIRLTAPAPSSRATSRSGRRTHAITDKTTVNRVFEIFWIAVVSGRTRRYTIDPNGFYDASRKRILRGMDGVIFEADSQDGVQRSRRSSPVTRRVSGPAASAPSSWPWRAGCELRALASGVRAELVSWIGTRSRFTRDFEIRSQGSSGH